MKVSCKQSLIAAFLLALPILSGCSSKTESYGNLDEIIVFADSSDWPDYKEGLDSLFGKIYLTPIPEQNYVLSWKQANRVAQFKNSRNIMFLACLDSKDSISARITPLLKPDVIEGIITGNYFYIPQKDVWALEQYVVYLVAPTKDDMLQRIYDLGELVLDDFERSYYRRLMDQMYANYENKKLEGYLLEHFPFTLKIQHDYGLVDESQENRYIWLRRLHPERDRSLAVHWMPYSDSLQIDFDWMVKQRNALAAKIFSGDVVVNEETRLEQSKFGRWPAYRLEGTWKNPQRYVGGPFRTIVFADKESNLVFLIDIYVQAIGERKKMYLDQLEIMAHTFRSKNQVKQEG